jgi:hypothetical protein
VRCACGSCRRHAAAAPRPHAPNSDAPEVLRGGGVEVAALLQLHVFLQRLGSQRRGHVAAAVAIDVVQPHARDDLPRGHLLLLLLLLQLAVVRMARLLLQRLLRVAGRGGGCCWQQWRVLLLPAAGRGGGGGRSCCCHLACAAAAAAQGAATRLVGRKAPHGALAGRLWWCLCALAAAQRGAAVACAAGGGVCAQQAR